MTRMKPGFARTLVAAVSLLSASLGAQQWIADIPASPFVHPSGPHGIGTYEWLWVDQRRPEPYTKDPADKRKLPVQVLYPADVPANATRALYIVTPEEFGPSAPFKTLEPVRTNAVTGAPIAKAEHKYPVLIYNHGAGWPRFTGTFAPPPRSPANS